jgi:RHS repeat-associated protein
MEIGEPSSNIEFQYTDKELDEGTGLYNFHARYRDPVDNRFYGRDRVKLEDNLKNYFGINPYLFTNNNPVRNVDEDGNDAVSMHGGVDGTAASTTGLANRLEKFYYPNATEKNPAHVVNWSDRHDGNKIQRSLKNSVPFIQDYKHQDNNVKVFAGHSMGADAVATAYGKESANHADRLILIMPRGDLVKENIQNMSQNANRVDIYMLPKDSLPMKTYGDRGYINLMDGLKKDKISIPKNVFIHELPAGIKHGGAGNDSAVLDLVFPSASTAK